MHSVPLSGRPSNHPLRILRRLPLVEHSVSHSSEIEQPSLRHTRQIVGNGQSALHEQDCVHMTTKYDKLILWLVSHVCVWLVAAFTLAILRRCLDSTFSQKPIIGVSCVTRGNEYSANASFKRCCKGHWIGNGLKPRLDAGLL